jgi:hypothetical protein
MWVDTFRSWGELLWLDHTTCYRGVSDKILDHLGSTHWNLVQASNSESKLNLNVSCMWVWDVDVKGQTIFFKFWIFFWL